MSLLSGPQSGVRAGVRSGVNATYSAMSGVTRDATSSGYVPQSGAEWAIATTDTTLGTPVSLHLMQDAGTPFADSIGSRSLVANVGTLQSAVTGWTTKGWRSGENSGASFGTWTLENPSTTSMLVFLLVDFQASVPVGDMSLFSFPATGTGDMQEARITTTKTLKMCSGANTATTVGAMSGVKWIAAQIARNRTESNLYTPGSVITPTWTAPGSSTSGFLGGFLNTTNACYMQCALFTGTAAQASQVDVSTVLARLNS